MQLFGVEDSPNNVSNYRCIFAATQANVHPLQNSPELPKLSSRATALLTAVDKSHMARAAGGSLGSVPESPEDTRGAPMTTADLDMSAASVGLLGIDDSPGVPELSASLGASLRRGTPGRSRATADKAGRSFLSTLSPILPQPDRTVGNALTPEAAAPASPHGAFTASGAASEEDGDSPAMPTFKSAATRAVLSRSTSVSASVVAGAGAVEEGKQTVAAAADGHSDSEDDTEGQGDFDLSLFPATFRSGAPAAQLIEVWSRFAMQDEGSFYDAGHSIASSTSASGALSELDILQHVPGMADRKLQLLLGMLESKGLIRKFKWQGQTMWRKR